MVLTACFTGLRTGEVCGLTWDDIDLENRLININHNVYHKNNEINGIYSGTDIIRYPFKVIHHELRIKNCRTLGCNGNIS